jgi:hypothetical protein
MCVPPWPDRARFEEVREPGCFDYSNGVLKKWRIAKATSAGDPAVALSPTLLHANHGICHGGGNGCGCHVLLLFVLKAVRKGKNGAHFLFMRDNLLPLANYTIANQQKEEGRADKNTCLPTVSRSRII